MKRAFVLLHVLGKEMMKGHIFYYSRHRLTMYINVILNDRTQHV